MVQILGSLSVGTVSLLGSDSHSQPVPPSTISKQVGGNIRTCMIHVLGFFVQDQNY